MEQKSKAPLPAPAPAMVAARATLQHFRSPPARHRSGNASNPAHADSMQAIKAQLKTSVLAEVRQEHSGGIDTDQLAASVYQSILAKIQPQLQDTATCAQSALSKVHSLESTVANVATKVDAQERSLRNLFSEQMTRIEELFGGKRQRQEWQGTRAPSALVSQCALSVWFCLTLVLAISWLTLPCDLVLAVPFLRRGRVALFVTCWCSFALAPFVLGRLPIQGQPVSRWGP